MSFSRDYLITHAFSAHSHMLHKKRSNAVDFINSWARELKAQVDQCAQMQEQIVDDAYKKAKDQLSQMETQYRETCWTFESRKAFDQVDLLLSEAKKLQIELVNIDYKFEEIRFIKLKALKSFLTDQDQANDSNNLANNDGMANSVNGTGRTSLSGATTSATSDSRQQRPSSSTHAGASNSSSSSQNNQMVASSTVIHINEDRICRRCYMIFPSSASKQHIRDHADSHDR